MTGGGYPSRIPYKFRSSGGTQEFFTPLALPPGLWHNGTRLQAEGRWYHASRVRWYEGIMAPIGGWANVLDLSGNNIQATTKLRLAYAWRDNGAISRLSFGSASKWYAYADGVLSDVTPAGFTSGRVDGVFAGGNYGAGLYGAGFYGTGSGGNTFQAADTWQLDNFGEVLVGTMTGDGKLYQLVSPFNAAATVIANAPVSNQGVVVTPERFLVALGAGGDPRLVQWPDQQSLTAWTPAVGSQAGQFPLQSRGRLSAGRRLRTFTLLWTDIDVHAMQYIGSGSNAYAFQQVGDNCGLVAPNAVAVVGDLAYWMSYNKFFVFDGIVRPLDCAVLDFVFGSFNEIQRSKVVAIPNTKFNEITWLYPSGTSLENDSYVTYNWVEETWMYGSLQRNCGVDRGVFQYPMMLDQNAFLYQHEVGTAMSDGIIPFAESGPYKIADGDQVMMAQRFLSDEAALGDVALTLFGSINPTDTEFSLGPLVMTAPLTFRMPAARYIRMRFDQQRATAWRIGKMSLALLPGGYR